MSILADLRIKTNFKGFELEIEGSEETVTNVFGKIKDEMLIPLLCETTENNSAPDGSMNRDNEMANFNDDSVDSSQREEKAKEIDKKTTKVSKSSAKIEHYSLVKLKIDSTQEKQLIADYKSLNVRGTQNAIVALFYLYRHASGEQIFTLDLTYTLLKTVGEKVPKYVSQSLRDIKSKKQYIDRNEDGTYSLTHIGENFYELDLSKKTTDN